MRIVDQGLLEWIKVRVEGPALEGAGYVHDYELFDLKGKCIQKWHGDYRSDPYQLAIWIYDVAWFHGDDQYKVMIDRRDCSGEFVLKVTRDQDPFSAQVTGDVLFKLFKWYDALAHRFTIVRVELCLTRALDNWSKVIKREEDKPILGEWIDLARPNDEVIVEIYKKAHLDLEQKNKTSGWLTLSDSYSVLCFIKDNMTPARFDFEVDLQMGLVQDKKFDWAPVFSELGARLATRKGKDSMKIDHGLMVWARKLFTTDDAVEKAEVRDTASDVYIGKWNGVIPTQGKTMSAYMMASALYAAAWSNPGPSKRYKAIAYLKDGNLSEHEFEIEAPSMQAAAGRLRPGVAPPVSVPIGSPFFGPGHHMSTHLLPSHRPSNRTTYVDWLEKSWPMIEKAFGIVIENASGKPYSVELQEKFMQMHEQFMDQYFVARQQDKAQKDGIMQVLGSLIPAMSSMFLPQPSKGEELKEKFSAFFLSLDAKQVEALHGMLTPEQSKKLIEMLVLVSTTTGNPTGSGSDNVPGPVASPPGPEAWVSPMSSSVE